MISLDDAKRHLRVDHTDEDTDIALKLRLAVGIVNDYIGNDDASWAAASHLVVDAATLLVLGELYANREAGSDPLSPTVRVILERTRKPAYA